MVYIIVNNNATVRRRKLINFLEKYNIEYKVIKGGELSPEEREKIIFLDITEPIESFFKSTALESYGMKNEFDIDYLDDFIKGTGKLTNFWIIDPEKKKATGGLKESLRKFIPREYREYKRELLYDREKLINEEEKYYNDL